MPKLSEQESYSQTSGLFVKLFSDMGADVTLHDLDIAHHMPQRNATAGMIFFSSLGFPVSSNNPSISVTWQDPNHHWHNFYL